MPETRKDGWPSKPLRELAQVVSGGTPSRYVSEFWEDGIIPWVTPTDVTNTPGRFLFDTREKITRRGLASCSATLLPAGTLLMTSRATLGEIRIAECEVCTNQGFKSLVPLPGTHGPFLYYQMLQSKERYRALGIGSTFLEVNKRDTERFEVLVPSDFNNQQRIAEILSTVDEAIAQTEALIAKTQQIKAGLMHDLFTRGVTADGQLRPPREEAPHLYKESPLGWIPKEWEVRQLAHLYAEPARNGLYKPAAFHGRGPYMVQMGNIFRGLAVDFEGASRVEVTASELATYGLREGDLLFGRRSLVMEGAGKCALVDKLHEPSTFESSIIRVRLDRSRIVAEFAALFLSSEAAYRDRRRFIRQVAVSGVSGADVKQFSMILPSPAEQATICASIRSASHQIESAQTEARKLAMLKHVLMQDLLTGRVPVIVDTALQAREVAPNV